MAPILLWRAPMILAAALLASLLIGLLLGLLGGGGSLLTLPLLTEWLGVEAHRAAATSLVVVGVTAVAGLVAHARAGRVRFRAGWRFGFAGLAGAAFGGFLAGLVPAAVVLGGFTVLMLVSAGAMLVPAVPPRPAGGVAPGETGARVEAGLRLWAAGAATGLFAGAVGAGGGFLVVPALTLFGGLPIAEAIGTSLLVVALNAVGGVAGYAAHVDVDWTLAGALSAAMVVGSLVGARFMGRVPALGLRRGFALLLLGVGALLGWRLLGVAGAGLPLLVGFGSASVFQARRRRRARVSAGGTLDAVV